MIRANDLVDLTIDALLKQVTQEQIMVYYLGVQLDLNRVFSSPFRADANPSCAFYYGKNGKLYLHDFAEAKFYGFVDVVMKKLKCNYYNALKDVQRNLKGISYFNPIVSDKLEIDYTYTSAKFLETYFSKQGISKSTLLKFNAKLVGDVFKNDTLWASSTKNDPIYVYEINGRCKIYRPLTPLKKNKWRSSAKFADVFGMKQLPKSGVLCFITSSVKDMMVLNEHGFPSICFASEGLPQRGENVEVLNAVIEALKHRYRFVASLLDSDEVGQKNASYLYGKYGILPMSTPIFKDISDFQRKFKMGRTVRCLKRLISKTFKS